jgi:CubicO group peptidase (beta-lactamase class C family)
MKLSLAICATTLALCPIMVSLAAGLAPVDDPEKLGFSPEHLARITSWYQARIDATDLPGAVIAIARPVRVAYLRALGYQDNARMVQMKPDAIFWIASMTKPITSVAALMLAEEGKLDIGAPVHQYLPISRLSLPKG